MPLKVTLVKFKVLLEYIALPYFPLVFLKLELVILQMALEYIVPPFELALLLLKVEFMICRSFKLYNTPPPPVALFRENKEDEINSLLLEYIAPPFIARLFVKLEVPEILVTPPLRYKTPPLVFAVLLENAIELIFKLLLVYIQAPLTAELPVKAELEFILVVPPFVKIAPPFKLALFLLKLVAIIFKSFKL
ncbi:hypothetical protein MBCUR_05960 [Methanobrevibacter curvatus]|uniref:Uncharacterized protein n=1 Tax=Methanobrevibacter curvatus TaxID=49547 RepID=A0A166C7K1_9EURY|nr:hypothetical protein MBCUR_05960 [Methanobrevibacter curvatus]